MLVASTQEIRELDRRAIEDYGMPGIILMENAGRGAAEVAAGMLGDPRDRRVLILCGRGNNGGDGFVIGRHLHNRGATVEFRLAATIDKVKPGGDAATNMAIAQKMGLPIRETPAAGDVPAHDLETGGYDLLIDALLGTGLSGAVREPYATLIRAINVAGVPVLAVDAPSGLNGDSGEVLGVAVRADVTVTFAAAKRGFFLADGPAHVGDLRLVDIGVPRELTRPFEDRA